MSNIMDFDGLENREILSGDRSPFKGGVYISGSGSPIFGLDGVHITDHGTPLPNMPPINEVHKFVSDRIKRSVLIVQLTLEAMSAVEAAGLDKDKFHLNVDSVRRFYDIELDKTPFISYNCVWFDWKDGDTIYRVATSVVFGTDNKKFVSDVDVFRLNPGDEDWSIYDDGVWKDYGPGKEYFDLLLIYGHLGDDEDALPYDDDDDEDDDDDDDDDEDDDEEIDPYDVDSLWDLGIHAQTIKALRKAGIYNIAELVKHTIPEVEQIKGVDNKTLAEIVILLDDEGYELGVPLD